jgi:hypothetical protein
LTQKIIFIVKSHERLAELAEQHTFDGAYWTSITNDGKVVAVVYPRHHHTRFVLAKEDGVIVLPTGHDPEPIGETHKHLGHIDAKPHHTGRDVGVMLSDSHGAPFHPDS